tara:strand:- start:1500 stop:1685 length:186 start_codon:yes stop_codon:yes gene_type:complete
VGCGNIGVLKKIVSPDKSKEGRKAGAHAHDAHIAVGTGAYPGSYAKDRSGPAPAHTGIRGR